MSYKNKPVENKETTTGSEPRPFPPEESTVEEKEIDIKALQEELEGKVDKDGKKTGGHDTSFAVFANSDENFRKRTLKDKYSEMKTKYGWKYDQPIKAKSEQEKTT